MLNSKYLNYVKVMIKIGALKRAIYPITRTSFLVIVPLKTQTGKLQNFYIEIKIILKQHIKIVLLKWARANKFSRNHRIACKSRSV